MVAFMLAAALQEAAVADVPRLRREARALLEEAHRLLDAGDYAKAVESHAEGRRREERARVALDRALAVLLPALDDDVWEAREAASARLLALGPCARTRIEALLRGELGPEVRGRLQDVLARLAAVEEDVDGLLHQWAQGATASSEYEEERWSARQATGRPDAEAGGDRATAWASKEADGTVEWLELEYALELRPRRIRIHETYNPGAVVKVEARGGDGVWRTLWTGKAAAREEP